MMNRVFFVFCLVCFVVCPFVSSLEVSSGEECYGDMGLPLLLGDNPLGAAPLFCEVVSAETGEKTTCSFMEVFLPDEEGYYCLLESTNRTTFYSMERLLFYIKPERNLFPQFYYCQLSNGNQIYAVNDEPAVALMEYVKDHNIFYYLFDSSTNTDPTSKFVSYNHTSGCWQIEFVVDSFVPLPVFEGEVADKSGDALFWVIVLIVFFVSLLFVSVLMKKNYELKKPAKGNTKRGVYGLKFSEVSLSAVFEGAASSISKGKEAVPQYVASFSGDEQSQEQEVKTNE